MNKSQKTISIYFHGDSTIWSDNKKELILYDKNYKEKIISQLNVLKNFRKEEVPDLTRNHLSCNIFCVLEKDKKTELLESPLLVKEKKDNKLEFCISKSDNKKIWVVDFVSDHPSGSSSSKAKKEGYLWISEKDLDCEERETYNHNHAESVALYAMEQNKHLFIKLLENYTEGTIKAFGIKFFSLIDSCQHCNEEMHDFLKKIRSPLHHLVKTKSFLIGYQSQKKVPFYVFFYSWRPYNSTEYTIINTSDQQKSICKSLSNNGKNYFFENYSITPTHDFLGKEEIIANFSTIYSHIAVFEQSGREEINNVQEKGFKELEKECLNILERSNSLDLKVKKLLKEIESVKVSLEKVVQEKEQISEKIKELDQELKIIKRKEVKLENKIEIPPKWGWSI